MIGIWRASDTQDERDDSGEILEVRLNPVGGQYSYLNSVVLELLRDLVD
jgi:hypothetical protein